MDASQGAAEKCSESITLRRQMTHREFDLDDEDVVAPNQRASASHTKDKHDEEVHVVGQVKAIAKKLADFADGVVKE